jgi:hypothetical protein
MSNVAINLITDDGPAAKLDRLEAEAKAASAAVNACIAEINRLTRDRARLESACQRAWSHYEELRREHIREGWIKR